MDFYAFFLEPLSFDFMQRALFISLLIAIVCSIFSCFLILKGWSLMGDAVAHAVLPGLTIAFLLNIPLVIGAFFSGLACAVFTGYLKNNSRIKEDAIMGVVFSGMFAIGLLMMTKIETEVHLAHILFGDILGISNLDLIQAAVIAVVCTVIMLVKRKDFMLFCFDSAHANVIGLNVKWLNFFLLALLSLTIVAALKAAGIILVIAMLIAPGAVGFLLTKSFDKMLLIAILVSVFSCLFGTVLSFSLDASTAPVIVVIQFVIFLLALAIYKIKSL